MSLIDVISTVTGLETPGSSIVHNRLKEQLPEVATTCSSFKLPGRGQRDTPVTDVKGAVIIVMLLPGRAAAHVQKQAATTLPRHLGGDMSLVEEVARNHLVQEELHEDDPARLFGQAVESDAVKRKREEVTYRSLDCSSLSRQGL